MDHQAEMPVALFLRAAVNGEASMSSEVIEQVKKDMDAALNKQFNSGKRDKFKLRMSNIGKPRCQLWFQKNQPEDKAPFRDNFMVNMLLGDIVEAVFKGILRASGVDFTDNKTVTLDLGDGREVSGEFDMIMDGKVDDVKSCSFVYYDSKWGSLQSLEQDDAFGYIAQLVGYATAAGVDVGGWWVINKNNGMTKYVSADGVNVEKVLQEMRDTYDYITEDKPFERCFGAEPETYYGKETGRQVLCKTCHWCDFKKVCWPDLKLLPKTQYRGKGEPPLVEYVEG